MADGNCSLDTTDWDGFCLWQWPSEMDLAAILGLVGFGISMNAVTRSVLEAAGLLSTAGRCSYGLERTHI